MTLTSDIVFDYLPAEDIDAALAIEQNEYPADEAGSKESFSLRQRLAPKLFLGAYQQEGDARQLVGYVCATQASGTQMTHESMSKHVDGAPSVCIHSVCVKKSHQRKGIATALLKDYVARLEDAVRTESAPYERVALIAHDSLVPLYERAGFKMVGKSDIVHGSRPWFELRIDLSAPQSPPIPPGVLEALANRTQNAASGTLISEVDDLVNNVLEVDPIHAGRSFNKYDLLCPRPGCGSIILKSKVATWVERANVKMDPDDGPLHPSLAPLPPAPETANWWLIRGSPMAFENIGFTRGAEPGPSGKRLKYLICAECDLGPLGWSEEGGSEFWLSCSRVRYRT